MAVTTGGLQVRLGKLSRASPSHLAWLPASGVSNPTSRSVCPRTRIVSPSTTCTAPSATGSDRAGAVSAASARDRTAMGACSVLNRREQSARQGRRPRATRGCHCAAARKNPRSWGRAGPLGAPYRRQQARYARQPNALAAAMFLDRWWIERGEQESRLAADDIRLLAFPFPAFADRVTVTLP